MVKFLLFLVVASFFIVTGFRCAPSWIEKSAIDKTIERLVASGETDRSALRILFSKSASVSDIHSITFDDLTVNTHGPKISIEYDYEDRIHLFSNVNLVFTFTNKK